MSFSLIVPHSGVHSGVKCSNTANILIHFSVTLLRTACGIYMTAFSENKKESKSLCFMFTMFSMRKGAVYQVFIKSFKNY